MASGELSVLGSSFRGKRGIKNFKVEFSPCDKFFGRDPVQELSHLSSKGEDLP